jgi:D-aminopeptidase
VLLVADLEGIVGVDDLESLVFCSPGYPAAARRMTEEVAFVARLLLARGVERIRISDAHRAGAGEANLAPALLPPGCELVLAEDMYGGALLDGVEAVCAVGMHASGNSGGFGGHTVSLHTTWERLGRPLSETHVAALLAGERGVPFWFSAGDQVLEAELGGVPCVVTKHATGIAAATSRTWAEVARAWEAVVSAAPGPVHAVEPAPLRVRFQTSAEAEASGGVLVAPTVAEVGWAGSFTQQYEDALRLLDASEAALAARLTASPGSAGFPAAVRRLFLDPWA